MSFCWRKLFVKTFFLSCLVVMLFQCIFLSDLDLHVRGENSTLNRSIDLYTQKEPYSGKGANQPSDAFAPQEEVVLYAHVTYREDPVPGKIVAFEVHGPVNRFENISFTRTAVTNDYGIAEVSFRITWPNGHRKEAVFGVWNVVAVVDIAEVAVSDTLSFMVGWIVELIRVETVDVSNVSRISFMKNEHMHFRLTVKNIAMTDKIATLIIDVYDNLSISFGQVVLVDRQIKPGVTVLFIEDLLVPEWACLGAGMVYANAYTTLPTLGGVPWCPQVSTIFWIVKAIVHDVAVVSVIPSVTEAFPCQTVNVSVVVKNEGYAVETFDVSAYYDHVLIETFTVRNLAPQTKKNIMFRWHTCCLQPGNYTLSAEASVVPGEVDVEDNSLVNGVVRIKSPPPPPPSPPTECVLPKWLLALLFLLAVLVGACFVVILGFVLWWKHKRGKEEEDESVKSASSVEPQKEFKVTKKCGVCGREFPGVYTFCPHCMSFHSKD